MKYIEYLGTFPGAVTHRQAACALLAERDKLQEQNKALLEACRKALTCQSSMNSDVAALLRAAIAKAIKKES